MSGPSTPIRPAPADCDQTAGGRKLQADVFDAEKCGMLLAGEPYALRFAEDIDSTNAWASREYQAGTAGDGTVFLADHQSAGRGRRGRAWSSPARTSVSMSLLLEPDIDPSRVSMLTLVMGLAAAEGIRKECGVRAEIKWPNDIVCGGKKLCGILTEYIPAVLQTGFPADRKAAPQTIRPALPRSGAGGAVVIGTGINVNVPFFPEEVAETATSLYLESGTAHSREEVAAAILLEFRRCFEIFRKTEDMSGLLESYADLLVSRDREVRVLDPAGAWTGTARGINVNGELLVTRKDTGETERVFAGEVSVRGMLGYV